MKASASFEKILQVAFSEGFCWPFDCCEKLEKSEVWAELVVKT